MEVVGDEIDVKAAFELRDRPLQDSGLNGVGLENEQPDDHKRHHRHGRDGQPP
ncbi:MAG: hypothetical protein M3478_06350 [Planctomycetota bacterium]|nr:hypothetical protein [Planctomycetota bacterium]